MKQAWRDHCRPIIATVIEQTGTDDMKKLRKALRDAYPYGQRKLHPYKIWRSEIRRQLKLDVVLADTPLFKVKQ